MMEEILRAVRAFGGMALEGVGEETLEAFCQTAAVYWKAKIREDLCPEECGGFVAACAWRTLADLWTVGSAGGEAASFTAGEVSVRMDGTQKQRAAEQLRQQAQCLMLPYLAGDDGFALRGVRG